MIAQIETFHASVARERAERDEKLLQAVAPAGAKEIARLEQQAEALTAKAEEARATRIEAVRTVQALKKRKTTLVMEIQNLRDLQGIATERDANTREALRHYLGLTISGDPYAGARFTQGCDILNRALLVAPVVGSEIEQREQEIADAEKQIQALAAEHKIDLVALAGESERSQNPPSDEQIVHQQSVTSAIFK